MTHQRLKVAAIEAASDRGLFIQISELLHRWVIEDAAHERQLLCEPDCDHFIDRALGSQDRNAGGDVALEPKTVNPVEALQETTCGEVPIYVHSVMALVMQADPFSERGGV